ncbi:MAG: SCO1664 family protein [Actinomycetales bacterium]|nr:SCO1664 family protein [Actinomycetales bacterium]
MATGDKRSILTQGQISVTGRLVDASNATLFATVGYGSDQIACIYKPVAGERPLWDFPDGTLADREYAAFLVSDYLGLDLVPLTILREGPYGMGMVQEWIDIDESIDLADYFSRDLPQLRAMAFFDAIINNTDRKIGHLLPDTEGHLYGCDHGVTFHEEDKLRTVLWQWAGDPLTDQEVDLLHVLKNALGKECDLSPHLTHREIEALHARMVRLLENRTMPSPNAEWPAIPWPAF